MPHPSVLKAELRAAMLERIRRMNDSSRAAESRSIVRRILEVLPRDLAICAFFPLATEPDIRPLLAALLRRNQHVYLPVFRGTTMTFRRALDLTTLITSTIGIPEPPLDAPPLSMAEPVTVLVPGRAFDARGGRLGRGNGGYDRWIAEHRKIIASATSLPSGERPIADPERSRRSEGNAKHKRSHYIGVAFDCQIVHEVPTEEHDARVDAVITERGLIGAY